MKQLIMLEMESGDFSGKYRNQLQYIWTYLHLCSDTHTFECKSKSKKAMKFKSFFLVISSAKKRNE